MRQTLLAVLFYAFFVAPVIAQDHFVATTGNDSDAGDFDHPFATIQKGIDAATTAGSTVWVLGGTYSAGLVFQSYSGTPGAPITLRNYGTDSVTIDGGGTSAAVATAMLALNGVSNIVIQGLHFRNAINNQVKGILLNSGCTNISIRKCSFAGIHFSNNPADIPDTGEGASPLIAYGTSASAPISGLRVTGNKFYDCRTGQSEGVTLNGNVDGFTIDSNLIYNIGNIGIDAAGHRGVCPDPTLDQARNGTIRHNTVYGCISPVGDNGQIYVDGGKDILIENNTCYNGIIGIVAGCEVLNQATSGITIRNNIAYHNRYTGIQVGTANSNTEDMRVIGTLVSGNTCYDNDYNAVYAGQMVFKYTDSTTVINNIFASPSNPVVFTYYYSTGLGNRADFNLYWTPYGTASTFNYWQNPTNGYYSFSAYKAGTGQDAHAVCADPAFQNPAGHNFHLPLTSPAVNAGDPTYSAVGEVDMDGEARAVGIIDIGADETSAPTTAATHSYRSQLLSAYPNPTSRSTTLQGTQPGDLIRMYDLQGRLILASTSSYTSHEIDLGNQPTGIYLIVVSRDQGTVSQIPVMKQ